MKRYCCVLSAAAVVLFIACTGAFGAEPITLMDPVSSVNIISHLEYLRDGDNSLTIDDVVLRGEEWKPVPGSSVNFGFVDQTYWFRFTLVNETARRDTLYFEINYAMLDYVELYLPREDGGFRVSRNGTPLRRTHTSARGVTP